MSLPSPRTIVCPWTEAVLFGCGVLYGELRGVSVSLAEPVASYVPFRLHRRPRNNGRRLGVTSERRGSHCKTFKTTWTRENKGVAEKNPRRANHESCVTRLEWTRAIGDVRYDKAFLSHSLADNCKASQERSLVLARGHFLTNLG